LFAAADGRDAKVIAVGVDARVHLRVGHAVDDAEHVAGRKVQVAVHLGGVVFERVFEGFPIDRHLAQRDLGAIGGCLVAYRHG
jgi:hypothetical protein